MSRGTVFIPGKGTTTEPATDPLTGRTVTEPSSGSPASTGGRSDQGEYTGTGGGGEGDTTPADAQGSPELYEPKNVVIDFLEINHKDGTLNLETAFHSLVVTESIFQQSLSCRLILLDADEKLANLDMDGSEELKVGWHSEKNKQLKNSFRVYRVNVTPDDASGSKGKVYELFGMSEEWIAQSTMVINRSFNGTIDKAVRSIWNEIRKKTKTKKNLYTHTCTGHTTTIVPGLTPFEAMTMFERRAYDAKYSSSIFRFYESMRGYNFFNLEQLIAFTRTRAIKYKYAPGMPIDDQKNVEGQFTIESIAFPKSKNLIDKIKSGAYASAVKEIDIVNQKIDTTELRVKDNFKDFYHLDKPAISLDKKDIIDESLNTINSTKWLNKYVDGRRHKDNNFGASITKRKFYGDSLSQVKMTCVVPGNSDLAVGTCIDLDMIESSANKEDGDQEKKISGKYFISEVNHQIKSNKYICTLACSKESYRANVIDTKKYIVGKR